MSRSLFLAAAGAALLFASGAAAETVAITNARILTGSSEIASGTVVIRDGRIASVGASGAPSGARVIDARGGVVTPGIVALDTDLGVTEVNAVDDTNDNATQSRRVSAAFDVQYGVDPASMVIPIARMGGITRAVVTPGYNDDKGRDLQFAGQAAVVSLGQGSNIVLRPGAAMVLDLGGSGAARVGGARGAAIVQLKAVLDDVRFYMRNKGGFDRGDSRDLGLSRADLEALIPVVEGRMPLLVSVHKAADIRQVLQLAREERLKVILDGAEEAWMVAGEIAAANVAVIINPTTDLPASFESRGSTMENAARLNAAGVTIAFTGGGGGFRARETRYNAGNAVSHGLPYEAAIKAITVNPARIFGMDSGALESGKAGDVVVWDGDPLEPMTRPTAIFINGVQQPLTSRQTELRDRYRNLTPGLPQGYVK